jgi:hypothetical protein
LIVARMEVACGCFVAVSRPLVTPSRLAQKLYRSRAGRDEFNAQISMTAS